MPARKHKPDDIRDVLRQAEIALARTKIGEAIDFGEMMTQKTYGSLNVEQEERLTSLVKGKKVYDLGAANMVFSYKLLELGADIIIAIDKELSKEKAPPLRKYPLSYEEFYQSKQVDALPGPDDVCFISWPSNHEMRGLLPLIGNAGTVVYLGKNTDGSACAWPGFFERMLHREILHYVPHEHNTFIAYGPHGQGRREPRGEEIAGMEKVKMYTFEGAEKLKWPKKTKKR